MIIAGEIAKQSGTNQIMKEKEEKREFWPLVLLPLQDIFGALPWVHYIHNIYHFEAREVRSPTLQTVSKSKLKRKSYSHCKKIAPSWKENFAHLNPRCETPSWHTSGISHGPNQFLHSANQGAKISHTTIQGAKFIPTCENHSSRCEFSKRQFRTQLFKVQKFSHHAKHLSGTRVPPP